MHPPPADLVAELASLRAQLAQLATLHELRQELGVEREEASLQRNELLESRRELETSHERYVELFDFAPVAYVTHDPFGIVLETNLQASVLFEVERDRMVGWPLVNRVIPTDRRRFLRHLGRCRSGANRVETEMVVCSRSGRRAHVLMTSRRVPAMPGTARYSAAIIDLSERDRAETERGQAAAERERVEHEQHVALAASNAIDHFLGVLGHELRTPLTPVLLAIETAIRRGVVPDHLRPLCDLIRRSVQLEARLIDDLLDVTRIRQGRLRLDVEPVDLYDVVDEVCRSSAPVAEAGGLTLTLAASAERHWVRGDPNRLRQVCWNLLQNAIRNTPAGGAIEVRMANATAGAVSIRVADSGRGIPPERLAELFTPFVHEPGGLAGPGMGIGLSIARGLVEAHDGRITAKSDGPGLGATFEVELPTIPRPATAEAPPPARTAAPGGRLLTVLLVEDNEDNAVALADLLELHGFRVERARTVEMALAHAAADFDVIVSDIGLPDGSGLDIVRRLGVGRTVKAIALSGYGTPRDVEESLAAGFALHLTKPVDPDRLVSAIRQVAS